jgi:hypothetical protein
MAGGSVIVVVLMAGVKLRCEVLLSIVGRPGDHLDEPMSLDI